MQKIKDFFPWSRLLVWLLCIGVSPLLGGCWVTWSEFTRERKLREVLEQQFRKFKRDQRDEQRALQKRVDQTFKQQVALLGQLQQQVRGFQSAFEQLDKRVKQGQGGVVEMFTTLEKLQQNFQQSLGQVQDLQQQIRDLIQKMPESDKRFQEIQQKYEALLKNQQLLAEQAIPAKLFARAEDAFKQQKYEDAMRLFRTFLQRFGTHDLADSAYLQIGEIHRKNNRVNDAILAYDDLIRKYPQGNSVPFALSRLGQLHYQQGLCREGRNYFRRLMNYRRHAPDLARLGGSYYRNWQSKCKGARRIRPRRSKRIRRRPRRSDSE